MKFNWYRMKRLLIWYKTKNPWKSIGNCIKRKTILKLQWRALITLLILNNKKKITTTKKKKLIEISLQWN